MDKCGCGQKLYNVLFTGGLDSAYRLCQLALDGNAVVQPIYILFPNDGHVHFRPEMEREVEAQDKILSYVREQHQTKAKILPIRRIHRDEIPKDAETMLYEPFIAKRLLGWQYLYIALLARWIPNLELCHETFSSFMERSNIRFVDDGHGNTVMDTEGHGRYAELLFGNLFFPIMGVTRERMRSDLRSWGYEGVWEMICFCYRYIDGKPCGACDNCIMKLDQGLFFLFDKKAIRRYYIYKVLDAFGKVDLVNFYKATVSFGEGFVLGKMIEIELSGRRKCFDNLFGLSFFRKLFLLGNDELVKVLAHKGDKDRMYGMIMKKRVKG